MNDHGDTNNSHAGRMKVELVADPAYSLRSLAIREQDDDASVRARYRPFLTPAASASQDWVAQLELSTVLKMVETTIIDRHEDRLRILVLYGSLRTR
jgi:arsenical resistance protein ArsH